MPAPAIGECIQIDLHLGHSAGVGLDFDRITAQIDQPSCNVTMTDGSTRSVTGHHYFDVADVHRSTHAHRIWHMPRGCRIKVHARELMSWYTTDEIHVWNIYGDLTNNDICLRYNRYYGQQGQGTCDEVPAH